MRDCRIDPKWEKDLRKLSRARETLLHRKQDQLNQASEESTPSRRNMADVGTDEYDRDLALAMATAGQETLDEIDQALNRIRNGTYGVCELSGKPISRARLDAIPWTRFSAEAERQLEAEGQVHGTHLGDRQQVPKENRSQPAE